MKSNNIIIKTSLLFSLLFFAEVVNAQAGMTGGMSNWILIGLGILVLLILLFVGDSLLKLEAKSIGADEAGENYSILPNTGELFGSGVSVNAPAQKVHVLKQGHDINLEGKATDSTVHNVQARTFSIKPTDFIGLQPIPKVTVAVGETVKAGDVIFYDKKLPDIKFCSPVSGEVLEVKRGAKRSIAEIIILADIEQSYREYEPLNLNQASRDELKTFLAESGVWPMIKQRPYQILADLEATPRDIFISTFDTAPLAPDSNVIVKGREEAFQAGLDVLGKLTDGKVYLGIDAASNPSGAFTNALNVDKHYFKGKHPAGNVGVQIHHIKPINAGDVVWTLGVQEVISIGSLFTAGKFDAERVIVLAGAELEEPKYIRTKIGASIGNFLAENIVEVEDGEALSLRVLSGDVLTGSDIGSNGHLGFFDDQITVLQEGAYNEMFGWLLPLAPRPSVSRTFPGFLMPSLEYRADTNTHGEKRAFVVTGQYEKVLPMDIYVQHLMKSILVNDYERMEGLGLYELAEEDVAICEFVCTSKQPLQSILREGLDMMREQG